MMTRERNECEGEEEDSRARREAVAKEVLEASTKCSSAERKARVWRSVQTQLTTIGLDLMGRTGDISETSTTNKNTIKPSDGMENEEGVFLSGPASVCLLYTSPSPRDLSTSRMPSSA